MAKKLTKKEQALVELNEQRLKDAPQFRIIDLRRSDEAPKDGQYESDRFFFTVVFQYKPYFIPVPPKNENEKIFYHTVKLDVQTDGSFTPRLDGFKLRWLPALTKMLADMEIQIETTLKVMMRTVFDFEELGINVMTADETVDFNVNDVNKYDFDSPYRKGLMIPYWYHGDDPA